MEMILTDIEKSYGKKKILKGVSTNLEEGIYGFLGANGVGKTTLFGIISGYISDYSGNIVYPELKSKDNILMGLLPQKFTGYPDMSVEEFMNYMGHVKADKTDADRIKADTWEKLNVFDLAGIKNKKIRNLSGGQLRRLGIAQAFQLNPKVVLLDEPTTGLDPSERVKFKNYISEAGERQIILISTHIVSDLEHIAKRIYILKDGVFAASGSEAELAETCPCKVWEIPFRSEAEMTKKLDKESISMVYAQGEGIIARCLSKKRPCSEATSVKPNLSEIFLSFFETDK